MQQFDSFAQMQRDAERRVMEMQKRAAAVVGSENEFTSKPPEPTEPPPLPVKNYIEQPPAPEPKHIFQGLEMSDEESEKALLIMILFLLLREDADEKLILTLLYILM